MREQIIKCDGCRCEIKGDPIKVYAEKVDRVTGDFSYEPYEKELLEKDFCESCTNSIIKKALTIGSEKRTAATINPDFEAAVQEMIDSDKKEKPVKEKRGPRKTPYRPAPAWKEVKKLRDQGMSIKQIADKLDSSYSTVSRVLSINTERTEEKEDTNSDKECHLQLKPAAVLKEKKSWFNPNTMIKERSDDGKLIVTKKKEKIPEGTPIKVNVKNCMTCQYHSPAGYCDYLTITGIQRNDKKGICTHKKYRGGI